MAQDLFGYSGGTTNPQTDEPKTELDEFGNPKNPDNPNDKPQDKPNDNPNDKPQDNPNNTPQDNPNDKPNDKPSNTPNDLTEGTVIEVEDKKYTVDKDGNLIDDKGEIFKEAKDVKEWLKDFETSDDNNESELTVDSISKALDLEIVDDKGQPIHYDNTPEGVKEFVKDAIESGKEEIIESTINSLYDKFYFIKPMIDYYVANGNSLEGYNEIPDRSGITIDSNDAAQQEAIVRMAWKENGRKGNIDAYIEYLKSSNTLEIVAKDELKDLQESDKTKKEELEQKAAAAHQQALEESKAYWDKVKASIESKQLGNYKLPDNIIIERNGKKITATLNDFYNYIARNDKDGLTEYAKDLMKDSPESRLEDDILRAYLKFTGGNYSNLIDMAINEEKVKVLKLRATQTRKGNIRITSPQKQDNHKELDYGY